MAIQPNLAVERDAALLIPLAGHAFLLKTWGTHNLPERGKESPCTTQPDQRVVAGSPNAILLEAGGNWHVLSQEAVKSKT